MTKVDVGEEMSQSAVVPCAGAYLVAGWSVFLKTWDGENGRKT